MEEQTAVSALQNAFGTEALDSDLTSYLSALIVETFTATSTPQDLVDAIGPFLEANGCVTDDDHALTVCSQLHAFLMKSTKPQAVQKPVKADTPALRVNGAPVRLNDMSMVNHDLRDFLINRNGKSSYRDSNEANVIDYENGSKKKKKNRAKQGGAGTASASAQEEQRQSIVFVPVEGVSKSQDISVEGVTIGYDGMPLLDHAHLKLVQGRKYGLVGRNGEGKTTLLRHIAERKIEGFPSNVNVLHVAQEVHGGDESVLQCVVQSDVRRERLLERERRLLAHAHVGADGNALSAEEQTEDAKELISVYKQLEEIDSATAEQRARDILLGLQFTDQMLAWPTKSLSGGWRMRVAIACALYLRPHILMLDEPTNHLDFPAVLWLEEYLKSYEHTLILVSHDRNFLNNVTTDIIHLHSRQLDYYTGNYDTFVTVRDERRIHAQRAYEAQQAKREHMQAFIDKFRYNANRAALVQSRIKALERMEEVERVEVDDSRWNFIFPQPAALTPPVLQIIDVTFGYDSSRTLFSDVNIGVAMDSRIGILGPNGTGKSTLLKIMLDELEPTDGAIRRNPKLRCSYFTQHHIAQLDHSVSPLEFMMNKHGSGVKEDEMRAHLGRFGISGDLALQQIDTLSGGQKSRVAFASMSFNRPHIIIMDEPTNHLDIETIDSLLEALKTFTGGVVCVSHDRYFLSQLAQELWVLGHGTVTRFKGTLKEYEAVAEAEKPY